MRSTAKVGEVSVGVEGNRTVLKFADELCLVFVAFLAEILKGLFLRHILADKVFSRAGKLEHLVFNFFKVGLCDGLVSKIHVVVESALDGRAYSELDAWIYSLQRLSHKV